MNLVKKALNGGVANIKAGSRVSSTESELGAAVSAFRKDAQLGATGGEMAARALIGAGAGGLMGRYVTPKILGYNDNPHAVNMSTVMDATMGGFLGGGLHKLPAWMSDAAMAPKLMGGIGAAELMPVGMNMLTKGTQSAKDLSEAAKGLKIPPSISDQVMSALQTPEARGAGTGAAGAALVAILSGLLRPRTQSEAGSQTGRGTMITKDFLKYLIPAVLAGGLAGNMLKRKDTV